MFHNFCYLKDYRNIKIYRKIRFLFQLCYRINHFHPIKSPYFSRFPKETESTSSNHFRGPDDLQFQFAYFYFLINEPRYRNLSEALSAADANDDGDISWEEMESFIAGDPIYWESGRTVTEIRDGFKSCQQVEHKNLSIDNIVACRTISSQIENNIVKQKKYKHEIVKDEDVFFTGLSNDLPSVTKRLNEIRTSPKKFISINDDRDHDKLNDDDISRVYTKFLETMFPTPSPFEHPSGKRNEYHYLKDYTL